MNALSHAQAYVDAKLRERNWKNRSSDIDKFNRFVGNRMGDPYCAAGVSYCFHLAKEKLSDPGRTFPYCGASQGIKRYFKRLAFYSENAEDLKNWKGALFGWTLPDGAHGHIGFVKGRLTDPCGNVIAIQTLEFNTSAASGERDGEGAFRLHRTVPIDRGHRLWFLNTTEFVGGRWLKKGLAING